jgi:hypothetical protein
MDSSKKPNEESLESETPEIKGGASGSIKTAPVNSSQLESLETSSEVEPFPGSKSSNKPAVSVSSGRGRSSRFFGRFNLYLAGFVVLIGIGIVIVVAAYAKSNHQSPNSTTQTENLSPQALQQLANNGTTIGDAESTLNIQSNAVFQNTVLVRGDLDVAGEMKLGSSLSLPSITATGPSSFGQLQAQTIAVAGNEGIQGQLTANSVSIDGGGTFNGAITAQSLTASSLQLNGDLELTHHINTGGPIPTSSPGNALGSGGTTSANGSDTNGKINIHTGGSPAPGCFITVFFARAFDKTPDVVVTPVGSSGAGLNYYLNVSTSNFSVCSTNSAPAQTDFNFDYVSLG